MLPSPIVANLEQYAALQLPRVFLISVQRDTTNVRIEEYKANSVLFLCIGKLVRSMMVECVLPHVGEGRLKPIE